MSDGTAAAIAARGAQVTLSDGSSVQLRYSMLSLERLEADFGSLVGIVEHVEDAARALQLSDKARRTPDALTDDERQQLTTTSGAKLFSAIIRVLLPGLLDAQAADPRTGELVWLEERPDVAKRVLDPGRLRDYMDAFRVAFSQSFDTGPVAPGEAQPQASEQAPASPGVTGTTSPAVSPVAQTMSSGA